MGMEFEGLLLLLLLSLGRLLENELGGLLLPLLGGEDASRGRRRRKRGNRRRRAGRAG